MRKPETIPEGRKEEHNRGERGGGIARSDGWVRDSDLCAYIGREERIERGELTLTLCYWPSEGRQEEGQDGGRGGTD